MATATSVHDLLADEVRAQIAANVPTGFGSSRSSKIALEWDAGERNRWAHDMCIISPGAASLEPADNESDFVQYRVNILLATLTADRAEGAVRLGEWMRDIRLLLGDRASDRSPLRTNPLPETSGDLSALNATVHRVQWTAFDVGVTPQDRGQRHAAAMELTVTTYEQAT